MPRWTMWLCLGLTALYLSTATTEVPVSPDTFTNMAQARAYSVGSVDIPDAEALTTDVLYGNLAWFTDSEVGVVSKYPPGVALWGAPFYRIDTSTTARHFSGVSIEGETGEADVAVPSFAPAALAAVAASVLAMLFLALTMKDLMPERAAQLGVATVALGTGVWSVAADELWQHTPGMMWISIAMYLSSRDRFAASGLAFGAAILTRPHLAIVAAAVGLTVAWKRRSIAPAVALGATSALGLVALVSYNRWVFGALSVSGGYEGEFDPDQSPLRSVVRLGQAFVDPDVGMLWTSPVILVGLVALWRFGGTAPDWAVGGGLGALAYLLVQYHLNRVSGGTGFFGYRYPLEPLAAAAPLLVWAGHRWTIGRRHQLVFGVLATASVVANAYGAITHG